MNLWEQIITIGVCALATICTRALPFLLFSRGKTPSYIRYLGNALPLAIFAMLVVYCLKDVPITTGWHGLPEALGILITISLHLWQRNFLLSIAGGTVFYMLLMRWM